MSDDVTRYQEAARYLAAELQNEASRKTGLESRALAVLSANVALAALFFAISDQVDVAAHIKDAPASGYMLWGMIALGVSTLFAIAASVPLGYSAPKEDALRRFVTYSLHPEVSGGDVFEETLSAQLEQLLTARSTNNLRVVGCYVAVVGLAIGVGLLATALLIAE